MIQKVGMPAGEAFLNWSQVKLLSVEDCMASLVLVDDRELALEFATTDDLSLYFQELPTTGHARESSRSTANLVRARSTGNQKKHRHAHGQPIGHLFQDYGTS